MAASQIEVYDIQLFEWQDGTRIVQLVVYCDADPYPIIEECIPKGCVLLDHDIEDEREVFVFSWD